MMHHDDHDDHDDHDHHDDDVAGSCMSQPATEGFTLSQNGYGCAKCYAKNDHDHDAS